MRQRKGRSETGKGKGEFFGTMDTYTDTTIYNRNYIRGGNFKKNTVISMVPRAGIILPVFAMGKLN